MRLWLPAVALILTLSGCAYLLPGPYDQALDAPPPPPRPDAYPNAADQRALAPFASPAFQPAKLNEQGG
jgi:hypothetical protein